MDKKNLVSILDAVKATGVKTASALKELLAESDAKAVAPAGNLTARGRLEALFDEGTFMENGAYVRRGDKDDAFEGVICGWGAVSGRLVFAFCQDMSRSKGALTEAHAKKIVEIYRLATENGAPVIGIFDSAGALLPEGVKVLSGYGMVMNAVSKASGVIPQIAIIPGVCSGCSALIASMFDFIIISDKNGHISFNAPFAVDSDDVGTSEFAAKSGLAALTASGDGDCIVKAKELLSYLPMNNVEGTVLEETGDSADRAVDISAYENGGDIKELIKTVADNGKFFELNEKYAPEMAVGFVTLNGTVCGVAANRHSENGGILTACAARKASRMLSFCDAFDIPFITFVDSEGPDVSKDAEASSDASELAKLSFAYNTAKCPLITVICGEAYGTVFTVMGSKECGADVVLALENAKIGVMSAGRAVAFLWNDKISKGLQAVLLKPLRKSCRSTGKQPHDLHS